MLLVTERAAEQGAEILGVVERLLEEEGGLDEIFRLVYDQSLAATKEMFTSEMTSGRSMDIDQAIDYALRVNSEASNKNRK